MNVFEYITHITIEHPDGRKEDIYPESLEDLLRDGPLPGKITVHRSFEKPLSFGFWLEQAATVQDLQRAEEAVAAKLCGDEEALEALLKHRYGNLTLGLEGVGFVSVYSYAEFLDYLNAFAGVPGHIQPYVDWDKYIAANLEAMDNATDLRGRFYVFEPESEPA